MWLSASAIGRLLIAGSILFLVSLGGALACGLPTPKSKIWTHVASTTLKVEVGDAIDAVPEDQLDHVTLSRNTPEEVEASVVVVMPSGSYLDQLSTLTVVDGDVLTIYYRLGKIPADQPVLGCDSQARLTYRISGLQVSHPEKPWRVTVRLLGSVIGAGR